MSIIFLMTFLPPLDIYTRPEMNFEELLRTLAENLSEKEMKQVNAVRTFIDLQNLGKIYRNFPIDPRGNLSEYALREGEGLPEYARELLTLQDTDEKRLSIHSKIMARFFEEPHVGFLKRYYAFERDLRLCLTALRCKRLGVDLVEEFKEEDPRELTVAQLLAAKDQPSFEMPFEFQDFGAVPDKPFEQYLKVAKYRLSKIEEMAEGWTFALSYVIAYVLQFMIIEDYHALNDQTGNTLLYENVCNR